MFLLVLWVFFTFHAFYFSDFPRVSIGPQNPFKVEKDDVAKFECLVDAKPSVNTVKWTRGGRFIDTNFIHTIPRVSLNDAGSFVCSADNGLGQVGKAELTLDVLHAPIVTLPKSREVKENTDVEVECKISANPRPTTIQWFKEGDDKFHQNGPILRLNGITALHNGKYTCSVTNYVQPTGKSKTMRVGNATLELNVRHPPGKAIITPEEPFAIDGKSVTLTCGANPPGYPAPQFRWWKEGNGNDKTLAIGSEFTIDPVRLSSAGKYSCEPSNEHGSGKISSKLLEVYQAPKIITQLQTNVVKRAGDPGFHITCSAVGKPKPLVKWFKDGQEVLDNDSNMYQIHTKEQEPIPSMAYNVQSTLKFVGPERIDGQQLMPNDRGQFTCQFENEVSRAETIMRLQIEHAPVVVHQHNKVAYDLGETAIVPCLMQSHPAPRFEWSFGNNIIRSDQQQFEIGTADLGDDIFENKLHIFFVSESSYGEYTCKATNAIGPRRTKIRLQPKSKPENPMNIRPIYSSYNVISLTWDEGFDGGYNNTMFTIQYSKEGEHAPRYKDCALSNPCNISSLEQHTKYLVKVKARNIRGDSKFSEEASVTTKVDIAMIPKPDNVHYEKSTGHASFTVDDTPLYLIAKVELENPDGSWRHFDGLVMNQETFGEMPVPEPVGNLRVRLCLKTNELMCGPYNEALIVDVRPNARTSAAFSEPWLIGLIVILVLLTLIALLVIIRCCCCSNNKAKVIKDTETNGNGRPTIVHGTQPPPYTSTFGGIENKGVDTVKDVSDDNIKTNLYAPGQNGYSYHNGTTQTGSYPEQSNSNSNSANGGSVNSQDSLWNVKNSNGETYPVPSGSGYGHPAMNGYMPYDAMALQQQMQPTSAATTATTGGFGGSDDYTHYPYPDEYLNDRNRQYLAGNGDPYTSVNKPRQGINGDCK